MVKKIIVALIPLCFLIGFWFWSPSKEVQVLEPEVSKLIESEVRKEDEGISSHQGLKKESLEISLPKKKVVKHQHRRKERTLSKDELLELDRYFNRVEKEWDTTMSRLFTDEFGMDGESYQDYLKMREGFEDDKMEIFEEYHERLIEKYGESYTFEPSREMQDFEKRIKREYLEAFRKYIGNDNFKRYIEVLDAFNERIRREQEKDGPIMVIEF